MKNYKIGYTTGVYDMFHIGHLNILKRAKDQCEYLIVGVSTDELVKAYKSRAPVVPFEDRFAIVESIKYVDRVVAQTELDKYTAWRKLRYDVLFVGDDWKGTAKWEKYERELNAHGVDVVFLPYTRDVSSTRLREIISERTSDSRRG